MLMLLKDAACLLAAAAAFLLLPQLLLPKAAKCINVEAGAVSCVLFW